jgi:hypothetical protein
MMNIKALKIPTGIYTKWNLLLILFFLYFYWLMVKITLYYIPYSTTAAFLQIKQTEVTTLPEYRYIFYAHVYTSIFVLLFGFIQFFSFTSKTARLAHRFSGYQYAFLLLAFAAPSGIYMGLHANGGLWSKISFVLLGILWWAGTFIAMKKIRQRRFVSHRNWMMRSYALCLSAVTLRLWKVALVYFFHLPPMDVYQVIAWLGWVPNLLIAELIIYNKSKLKL